MRFVGVREAQVHLSGLVDRAQKERVILTRLDIQDPYRARENSGH